jgi:hypothetical protein
MKAILLAACLSLNTNEYFSYLNGERNVSVALQIDLGRADKSSTENLILGPLQRAIENSTEENALEKLRKEFGPQGIYINHIYFEKAPKVVPETTSTERK